MMNWVKIILAILLLGCLADMPYGYYQFVRVVTTVGFCYLAFTAYSDSKIWEMVIFIGLALLFQPLEKIALGRVLWNVVDVVVAIGLLATAKNKRD
jgi:hypothetical protein